MLPPLPVESTEELMNAFLNAIHRQVVKRPHVQAFANSEGERLSYLDLWSASDRLACLLHESVPGSEPLMVYGHKSPLMIVAFLACLKSGHAYVPTDSCVPAGRVSNILQQLCATSAICVEPLPPRACEGTSLGHVIGRDELMACIVGSRGGDVRVPAASWQVSGEQTQYIIFTSGSTGRPKGVEVTASDVANFMPWDQSLFEGSKEPRVFVNQALFSFDLSVTELVASLSTGGSIFALSREVCSHPKDMYAALADSNATCWVSTPSFMTMCLADPSFSEKLMPRCTHFFFCGEPLHSDVVKRLFSRFPKAHVINAYGPTESTVAVTSVTITPEMCSGSLPIGVARPGTTIRIVDRITGEEVRGEEEGEIVICGDTVAKGYYGQPEKTLAAFGSEMVGRRRVRTYRTGDLGHFDASGCLWCHGRIDNQVKIHGYRIELDEIDAALEDEPDVELACCVVRARHDVPDHLEAHVQLATGVPSDSYTWAKLMKSRLADRLPSYMVPRKIAVDENLPITPNGKVDRKALSSDSTEQ